MSRYCPQLRFRDPVMKQENYEVFSLRFHYFLTSKKAAKTGEYTSAPVEKLWTSSLSQSYCSRSRTITVVPVYTWNQNIVLCQCLDEVFFGIQISLILYFSILFRTTCVKKSCVRLPFCSFYEYDKQKRLTLQRIILLDQQLLSVRVTFRQYIFSDTIKLCFKGKSYGGSGTLVFH